MKGSNNMEKDELVKRSPIRIFEESIHGGLKPGEIGIIASPNGVGKTSVLVQLALDKLLQGKKVIHVSFTRHSSSQQHTNYVTAWSEDIFREIISKKNLVNTADVKNDLVKNRVLMNFSQDGISKDKILKSLRAMIIEGGFNAESVIIDGFDFSRADRGCISSVKTFAAELGLAIWYSFSVKDNGQQYDKENIPVAIKDFADLVDVVIVLEPKPAHVELSVSKDRELNSAKSMAMRLDPKTMLILQGV
jgi:archaellum biogenesis ATPase FlaH